jgi:acyl dehydratase
VSATGEMTGLHYEEMRVGSEFPTAGHEVTAAEIAEFAALTGDTNPLHTDPEAARAAGFRDLLVHGPLVQALTIGLIADTGIMRGTTVALLEVGATFHAPVFAGDTIEALVRISRKRPTGSPERGILWRRVTVSNQDRKVVACVRLVAMIRRLGAAGPAAQPRKPAVGGAG